jgi:hypothetical protein
MSTTQATEDEAGTRTTATVAPSPRAKEYTDEERRAAARVLGSISTPKKRAHIERIRQNAAEVGKLGGRPLKALSEIPCNCGAGDALDGHRWNCPRGQAIKRRQKAGTL